MPKSRHGKGKRYHYSKKSKALSRQQPPGATLPAPAAGVNAAVPTAPAAAPPQPKAAAVQARAAENPYPYITSEIKRIALLAAIIIVLLVVLSVVLT